jgi:hypothetical protein
MIAPTGTHGTALFPKERVRNPKVDNKVAAKLATIGVQIGRYRGSRFWAVWNSGELVAVTVYKKGAVSVGFLLLANHQAVHGRKASQSRPVSKR